MKKLLFTALLFASAPAPAAPQTVVASVEQLLEATRTAGYPAKAKR